MTREEKRLLRADLFRHLDGIVTAPTAFAIYKSNLLDTLLEEKTITLSEATRRFKANKGYLNVGLRVLASQGWLDYKVEQGTVVIGVNDSSVDVFPLFERYKDVVDLMEFSGNFHPRKFEKEPFLFLERIFNTYRKEKEGRLHVDDKIAALEYQVSKHVEGVIIGPTAVALGMGGMFHKYFMEASFRPEEFHQDGESFQRLLDIFVYFGWFDQSNGTYRFTEKGLFYARRASAYGVTVSYIPLFRKVKELMFGDPTIFWKLPAGSKEIHVDREMNVWGSGGAHSNYFKKIDEIIIDLFNKPIDEQPKGIVDMGCGNGAFLIHLFDVIERRTLRGTMLEDYPLFLVGADFNEAALKVTKANIIQADIWAKVIFGDIGKPELLAHDLQENYGIQLSDLLNVRTFLDHNRAWQDPETIDLGRNSTSTGAFAFRGRHLPNTIVEENLRAHFIKWAPYVKRFGLLVIELHTISPEVISGHLGKTPATAYDATHGFSDQYIVEIDVFHKVAEEAGLFIDEQHFVKFPESELATVSLNFLKTKAS